tara:strand:+ start:3210 stop:5027 length:1818 start_codon:yes stop_codon:yes gene_type:complete
VLLRPYDGAQFHSARSGVEWSHHALRLELAEDLLDIELDELSSWFLSADRDYPPLVPATTALLGFVVGHDEASIHRSGLIWLLLLALACALLFHGLWREPRLSVAAGLCALLLPAHHAAALCFYFDLPMAALLWSGLAALAMGQERRPLLAGLSAGTFFVLAALSKWSVLAFIAPLVLGVALVRPEAAAMNPRRALRNRLLASSLALLSCSAGLLSFWRSSSGSWTRTLSTSFGGPLDPSTSFTPTSWSAGIETALKALTKALGPSQHLQLESLYWYLLHFTWSYLSPALLLLGLLLSLHWLRRGALGWQLGLIATATHAIVLLGIFSSLDERFLLSLGPALMIPALLGWWELPTRLQTAVSLLFICTALWIAADYHHGLSAPPAETASPEQESDNTFVRFWQEIDAERSGFGLQSATDRQWGWMRADARRVAYFEARELAWETLSDCGAEVILAQEELTLDGYGDGQWWSYRRRLAALNNNAGPTTILGFGGSGPGHQAVRLTGAAVSEQLAIKGDRLVAITRYEDGLRWADLPLPVQLLDHPDFELRALIDRSSLVGPGPTLMDGPKELAIWTTPGSQLCGKLPLQEPPLRLPFPQRDRSAGR